MNRARGKGLGVLVLFRVRFLGKIPDFTYGQLQKEHIEVNVIVRLATQPLTSIDLYSICVWLRRTCTHVWESMLSMEDMCETEADLTPTPSEFLVR